MSPETTTTTILWRSDSKQGIIHRKIVQSLIITDRAVIIQKGRMPDAILPIDEIGEVAVMDQHRIGHSNFNIYGIGGSRRFRYYSGTVNQRSQNVGNVIFLDRNKNARQVWNNISDPESIRRLIKSLQV
jgi:hypothetical protein